MTFPRISLLARCGAVGVLAVGLTGCAIDSSSDSRQAENGAVQVFAASSLQPIGGELERTFERENPGADITFNYGGSTALVRQLASGAHADLLITADTASMDSARTSVPELSDAQPHTIATNRLVLVTAANNPAHIHRLEDLASGEVTTGICAAQVPCGVIAHHVLDQAHLQLGKAAEEENVAAVATKIATSAVDAGFVYSTDAAALARQGKTTEIPLPQAEPNQYPAALTASGSHNANAEKFQQWLASAEAQKILRDHGFGPAPEGSATASPSTGHRATASATATDAGRA